MKRTFLLQLLVIPFLIFGQSSEKSEQLSNWNGWEIKTDNTSKGEFISTLKVNKDAECEFAFLNLNEFHIVDVDNDGLNDIVYSGFCGTTGSVTSIYRFNGVSFEQLIKVIGVIHQVSKFDSNERFSFTLRNYACCGGFENVLEKYVLILENGKLKYQVQSRETYVDETEFPNFYFEKPIVFRSIIEKLQLRFSPIIDDTTYIARPFDARGNEVTFYPKNSIGYAVAQKKDITGKIWWFVKMNNKNILGKEWTSKAGDNSEEPTFTLGWINFENVERIK